MPQSSHQGSEFWNALWLSCLVCLRQILIGKFGVQILLETRKAFRLETLILNNIEIHLKYLINILLYNVTFLFFLKATTSNLHITMTTSEWVIQTYGCYTPEVRSLGSYILNCNIGIKRQSSFYVANIIVPMTITNVLTSMVFLIPTGSGEKIAYLLNVYISTSIFLDSIDDYLPKSMEKVRRLRN